MRWKANRKLTSASGIFFMVFMEFSIFHLLIHNFASLWAIMRRAGIVLEALR